MAEAKDPLSRWKDRLEAAQTDRKQYERQWQINQHFAAGLQWLRRDKRTGRVLPVFHDERDRPYQVADVLDQYVRTAIGKIAGGSFRPDLFTYHDDPISEDFLAQLDDEWQWGWEEEWDGERKAMSMLRILAFLGTGAIRVRYDTQQGDLLASQVPHDEAGQPIMDGEQGRAYVAHRQLYGQSADLRDIREGKVCWELLMPHNLLPQPGVYDPADLEWKIIARPVSLDTLKAMYPGVTLNEEPIDSAGMRIDDRSDRSSPAVAGRLKECAMVYTGYSQPCPQYPNGETMVFAQGKQLSFKPGLPLNDKPYGARDGVTIFRWSALPGRFWGKAFIEPGIGPQTTRNKRLTQIDSIIDHGLPMRFYQKNSIDPEDLRGQPAEWVPVNMGAQLPQVDGGIPPGAWMQADIELQDMNVEKALGLHDVSLGKSAGATAPYARIAYEGQNDVIKLEPIAKEFKAALADCGRDSFECMRQWPDGKKMMIAPQTPEGKLQVIVHERSQMPTCYVVRFSAGPALSAQPAAELQKVSDLFNAALQSTAVMQDPVGWMDWYSKSLTAGRALQMPFDDQRQIQRKKAQMENIVMMNTGQPLPVQPYDNHQLHVMEHEQAQVAMDEMLMMGDQDAMMTWQALEQHKQLHAQAQAVLEMQAQAAAQAPALQGPQGSAAPQLPGNGVPRPAPSTPSPSSPSGGS